MSVRELPQLRIVAAQTTAVRPSDRASVEIYRPFFVAGIISVLTAGCLLGAIALLGISLNASYTASGWTPYVLAHANSQLYGWVGFFIMGFALQQHAPSVTKAALFHRLAYASLVLMGLGIALRFAAEPLVAVDRAVWMPVGVASCLLQTAAVLLFVVNTSITRHRTSDRMPWQSVLVFSSLGWLLLIAIAEPFYFVNAHAANQQDAILFVAQWFPPYREAQFLGFVGMMIFGVALVKLHSCFGVKEPLKWLSLAGYCLWTFGIFFRMGGWVASFAHGLAEDSRLPYHAGGALLGLGGVLLILGSRIFEKTEFELPSHKFVRAAFVWLVVAGILMALEPIHLAANCLPFSHAFIGAIRHAVTVGFISQMIIGVSLRVVTRMKDIPNQLVRPLWATFWLLNVGNALRVCLEIATDTSLGAFLPMGFTGFIELIGLAMWGAYVGGLMLRRPRRLALA